MTPQAGPVRLSTRLEQLVTTTQPGLRVADIGTDHGLLAAALLERGRAAHVIATDIASAPLARARRELGPRPGLELRQGDGLAPLAPGEVEAVVIAGMGGRRMRTMLERAPHVTARLQQIVLQPNRDWRLVRELIAARNWRLHGEHLLQNRERFFLTLDIRPSLPDAYATWDELDLEYGPLLRRELGPAFAALVAHRKAELCRILTRIRGRAPARQRQLERELNTLDRAPAR